MPEPFDSESFLRDHTEKFEVMGYEPDEARRLAEAALPIAERQWETSESGRPEGR
jgi:hypothetical protein